MATIQALRRPLRARGGEPAVVEIAEEPTIGPLSAARAARWFWAFVTAHVLAWTVLPALTQPNRPLDMIEMLYWGHAWQWGYYKHPPLPAWIAEAVFNLSGGMNWCLFLVGALSVATSMWAAWTLAKEYVGPWAALCAAALLESCSYYNLMTADINNTIIMQPLWACAVLFLYRGITTGKLGYWLATGVALGLGMLAKYDMAMLACAMILLPTFSALARVALRTPGPYVALATSLAIFAPHVVWMIDHNFATILYAVERSDHLRSWTAHVYNPLEFVVSQIAALGPMLLIVWPLWRNKRARQIASIPCQDLKRDFLLIMVFAPFAVELSISILSGIKIQSMWGAPLWTFSGLCLVVFAGRGVSPLVFRRVVLCSGAIGIAVVLATVGRSVLLPHLRAKPSRIHFPGEQLAKVANEAWSQHAAGPIPLVTGVWWQAANVGVYIPGRVPVFDFLEPFHTPWLPDDALAARGGLLVWQDDDEGARYEARVRRLLPDATYLPAVDLPWQSSAEMPPVRIYMAIVPPPERR